MSGAYRLSVTLFKPHSTPMSNTSPPTSNPSHVKCCISLSMADDGISTHGRLQKIFERGGRGQKSRDAAGVEWNGEWEGISPSSAK